MNRLPRPDPVRPRPGQESAWAYPRPPRIESTDSHIVIRLGGRVIADSKAALRVLETSHPPVYYLPWKAFRSGVLEPAHGRSWCEYKGEAFYVTLRSEPAIAESAGWFYPSPSPAYRELRDHVAVYPGRVDSCEVDGELVTPQPGDYYGGWITSKVVGPFKGEPGSEGW